MALRYGRTATSISVRLPWSRAPRAALSSLVTVAVAVVTGAVVAFIAAGTVFHVSSSGSAAVQYVNGRRCSDESGLRVERSMSGLFGRAIVGGLDPAVDRMRESAGRHGLDLVRRSRFGSQLPMTVAG